MTILRGRRSVSSPLSSVYSSSRTSNRQTKSSIRLSIRQKNFMRKLVNVLSEVIDEKDLSDDPALETIETGGVYHGCSEHDTRLIEDEGTQDEQKRLRERSSKFEAKNLFTDHQEAHSARETTLFTLPNTLGGGDRAAKALEKMKEVLFMVDSSFYQAFYGIDMFLKIDDCIKALRALRDVVSEVIDAFDEFDVFSTEFFSALHSVGANSREIASTLDREFREEDCIVDEYLDAMFRPNTNNPIITRIRQPTVLEPYHNRDISAQCHSNDAADHCRRPCLRSDYNHELALASFACFQFCIGGIQPSGDDMATVAYSPTRPLIAVPRSWLASECTYAISRRGKDVSAAVPTALAGFHAYAILFLSAWYLAEQWGKQDIRRAGIISQLKLRGKMCYANFLKLIRKTPKAFTKGTDQPSHISSQQSVLSSIDGVQQRSEQEGSAVLKSENVDSVQNSAELPRGCSSSPVATSVLPEVRNGRCGDLLQFTSDCSFLASALLSNRQKNFMRKLVNVLSEVIDEKDLPDDPALETIETGGVYHGCSEHDTRLIEDEGTQDEQKRLRERSSKFEAKNLFNLEKIIKKHTPLIRHVKTLPNTLGGGNRAAKALEKMKEVLFMVDSSFYQAFYGIDMFLKLSLWIEIPGNHLPGVRDVRKGTRSWKMGTYLSIELSLWIAIPGNHLPGVRDVRKDTRSWKMEADSTSGKVLVCGEWITEALDLLSDSHPMYLASTAGYFGKYNCMIYDVDGKRVNIYHSRMSSLLHRTTTSSPSVAAPDFVSFALGHDPVSARPHLFAFGNEDGSVKIWSIQSNHGLDHCESAEVFEY
ncbi:hypothetical protein A7U60_g5494 [Sanghuangporus baumii]|uniref:Uncharacterized protein n=1 Tax=Sanghuangporus baumii TaxID=108892 RepID=A0A9Q5HWK8_SANBA|nr:hypothetical protein A7U60_g5494 [Sanghuangporus baumii]